MEEEKNQNQIEESATQPVAVVEEKKDRMLPISILIAAVLIGGSVIFATLYKSNGTPAGDGAAPTGPVVAGADVMKLGPRDAILGNANAPITLIEYGDYQCPFCVQFFSQTEPQIIKNYVDTGKVKMVFRNFAFLGPESIAAAAAAECAIDQNKLWAYHDALYAAKAGDEKKGGGESDGFYTRAEFLKLATQVGLDVPAFTQCIDSNKYVAQIGQERTAAAASGIQSTPTFYANGTQILGAQPYAQFQQTIDGLK